MVVAAVKIAANAKIKVANVAILANVNVALESMQTTAGNYPIGSGFLICSLLMFLGIHFTQ